jgi:hypothetical protein
MVTATHRTEAAAILRGGDLPTGFAVADSFARIEV